MANVIIANAFSINMLEQQEQKINFKPVTINEVRDLLTNNKYESSVGHSDTASLYSNILGVKIVANRRNDKIDKDTLLVVGQYTGPRLPEGVTSLPEGSAINWWRVEVL